MEHSDLVKMQMESLFHSLVVALGFTDSIMKDEDYNKFFPQNTRLFIDEYKRRQEKNNREDDILLCDVNGEKFRIMSKEEYNSFLKEIYDFCNFKLSSIMNDSKAQKIPFVGGCPLHYRFTFPDDELVYEATFNYIPEIKYYNKKSKTFSSTSKDIIIDEQDEFLQKLLEFHASHRFEHFKDKYSMAMEEAMRKAAPEE